MLLNLATAHPIEDELEYAKLLSSREREVFSLVAAGKLSKEIAAALAISTRTVETHRARIILKLDLHSVSDLVRYAVRNNFIRFQCVLLIADHLFSLCSITDVINGIDRP